jgi:uncharacterized protein (TIGR02271 family)
MSLDARDTNHDGKVSLMEKVKDKLHLGGHKDHNVVHTTTTHTTASSTGHNAQDLNHDGHVSASERLATSHTGVAGTHGVASHGTHGVASHGTHGVASHEVSSHTTGSHTTGGYDSRDLNHDGHLSASERLASGHTDHHHTATHTGHLGGIRETDEARLRLHEEQLAISKREVGAGEVDIHKRVHEEHVQQTVPLRRDEVTVERRPLHGVAEPGARIAAQDETVRVPLYREEVVTEKRIVPTEEVIVRKKEVMGQEVVGATLRSEYVETSQTGSTVHAGVHSTMDTNHDGHISASEKRKGGHLDARDTNHDGHVSAGERLKSARG